MKTQKLDRRRTSWVRVERGILADIASGRYKVGQQLPSFNALAEQYGVSYACIHRVIRSLHKAGKLVVLPGEGTFVAGSGEASVKQRVLMSGTLTRYFTKADLRHLTRQSPNIWIERAEYDEKQPTTDLSFTDSEGLLIQYHRKEIIPAQELGVTPQMLRDWGVCENAIAQSTIDGELIGVPAWTTPALLCINPSMFERHAPDDKPQPGWTLHDFDRVARKLTHGSWEEASRTFGFDFTNTTLQVYSLVHSIGGDWRTPESFVREENIAGLRMLWVLLHEVRSAFPYMRQYSHPTCQDLLASGRVGMVMTPFSEAAAMAQDRAMLRSGVFDLRHWGGEATSFRYLIAGRGLNVTEAFVETARLMLSLRFQMKTLRQGLGLPVILNNAVEQRMHRLFPAGYADLFLGLMQNAYSPWRVDGRPDPFWRAEQNVQDYLNDVRTLKDISDNQVRGEPWPAGLRRKFWES